MVAAAEGRAKGLEVAEEEGVAKAVGVDMAGLAKGLLDEEDAEDEDGPNGLFEEEEEAAVGKPLATPPPLPKGFEDCC